MELTRARVLILLFAALLPIVVGEIVYNYNGKEESSSLVQLFYEGYWQKIEPFTAPVTFNTTGDLRGWVILSDEVAPHESWLRSFQRTGALAVVFTRDGRFEPGFSMQVVDGSDRSDIVVPVLETIIPPGNHLYELNEGTVVHLHPTENLHKKIADTKFQFIMNLILSLWELAIIFIGGVRIYQFYFEAHAALFAIAPLCCLFEIIGAALRLAYTMVDPFFSYRMLSETTSNVLLTISLPFSETAGILLTFFYGLIFLGLISYHISILTVLRVGAETLTTIQIRAVPFISAYKIPAIIAVVILFVIEIICDVLRIAGKGIRLNPIYISAAICAIISIVLIICYVSCAVGIAKKLSGNKGSKRNQVWTMSIRIAVSSLGYAIVVVSLICLGVFLQRLWGRPMTFNSIFIGVNLSAIMQVIALQPISRNRSRSSSGKAKQNSHDKHSSAARTS